MAKASDLISGLPDSGLHPNSTVEDQTEDFIKCILLFISADVNKIAMEKKSNLERRFESCQLRFFVYFSKLCFKWLLLECSTGCCGARSTDRHRVSLSQVETVAIEQKITLLLSTILSDVEGHTKLLYANDLKLGVISTSQTSDNFDRLEPKVVTTLAAVGNVNEQSRSSWVGRVTFIN